MSSHSCQNSSWNFSGYLLSVFTHYFLIYYNYYLLPYRDLKKKKKWKYMSCSLPRLKKLERDLEREKPLRIFICGEGGSQVRCVPTRRLFRAAKGAHFKKSFPYLSSSKNSNVLSVRLSSCHCLWVVVSGRKICVFKIPKMSLSHFIWFLITGWREQNVINKIKTCNTWGVD